MASKIHSVCVSASLIIIQLSLCVYEVFPAGSTYKYGSRIFVQNVTYLYTGYYGCFEQNAPFSEDHTAKIYLYVKDEEHLSVNSAEVDTVIATQYHEVSVGTITEEGTIYQYHPHYGFITNNTQLPDQILFVCNFTRDRTTFTNSIIMDIEQITDWVPKPLIEEVSGGHTIIGERLVLECKVRTSTQITFKWITPTGPYDGTRMNTTPQMKCVVDLAMVCQQLTIERTNLNDRGVYYCKASDNQNHYSINSLNVTIYGTGNDSQKKKTEI